MRLRFLIGGNAYVLFPDFGKLTNAEKRECLPHIYERKVQYCNSRIGFNASVGDVFRFPDASEGHIWYVTSTMGGSLLAMGSKGTVTHFTYEELYKRKAIFIADDGGFKDALLLYVVAGNHSMEDIRDLKDCANRFFLNAYNDLEEYRTHG